MQSYIIHHTSYIMVAATLQEEVASSRGSEGEVTESIAAMEGRLEVV